MRHYDVFKHSLFLFSTKRWGDKIRIYIYTSPKVARVTGAGAMVDFHSPDYDEDDEFDDTCIFRDEVTRFY